GVVRDSRVLLTAGEHFGPVRHVLGGVGGDDPPAGRTRGGVDANHLRDRHAGPAEGIGVAQLLLGGQRQAGKVVDRMHAARIDAGCVQLDTDELAALVGVLDRPGEAAHGTLTTSASTTSGQPPRTRIGLRSTSTTWGSLTSNVATASTIR